MSMLCESVSLRPVCFALESLSGEMSPMRKLAEAEVSRLGDISPVWAVPFV